MGCWAADSARCTEGANLQGSRKTQAKRRSPAVQGGLAKRRLLQGPTDCVGGSWGRLSPKPGGGGLLLPPTPILWPTGRCRAFLTLGSHPATPLSNSAPTVGHAEAAGPTGSGTAQGPGTAQAALRPTPTLAQGKKVQCPGRGPWRLKGDMLTSRQKGAWLPEVPARLPDQLTHRKASH